MALSATNENTSLPRLLYSLTETQELLHSSRTTIWRLQKEGRLHRSAATKRRALFPIEEVHALALSTEAPEPR